MRDIKTNIATQIENLKVPVEARTKMCALYQMAKSVGESNGYLMPNLFIVSDGNETDLIGNLYAQIFDEFHLYPQRGEKNYFKLTYPVDGNDILYGNFFASADVVASTINKYYGIFAIDLSEWRTGKGIQQNINFMRLMDYVDLNKENITFIFNVNSSFQNRDELARLLRRRLNIEIIDQMVMDEEMCASYIVDEINKQGIEFTEAAKLFIVRQLQEDGYDSGDLNYEMLDLMVQRIILHCKSMLDFNSLDGPRIDWEFVNKISPKVFTSYKENKRVIGFVK